MSIDLDKVGSQGVGKRPKDFPKLHDKNIQTIIDKFDALDLSITGESGLVSRIETNETDIDDLKTKDTYLQSQITTINSNVATISADVIQKVEKSEYDLEVTSLQSQINNNIASIYALAETGSLSGVGAIEGIVHITDVTNSSNIDKTYLANTNSSVITSFISDVTEVTIELTGRSLNENWLPIVTVNETEVTSWSEQSNGKFTTSYAMTLSGSGSIEAQYENGTSHTISYLIATSGPSVLSATLGDFPTLSLSWSTSGNQTTLKEDDEVVISGTCDTDATYIEVVDDSGSIFKTGNGTVTAGNYSFTAQVSSRTGSKAITLRARNSLGTYGDTFIGTTTTLDQTVPSVSSATVTYPSTQSALKDSETASIDVTASDFTEIVYSSPTSELSIPSSTTYELTKVVTRISGNYNVSSNNYRVEARKASNGTSTTINKVVFIAHVAATVDVNLPYSRLRSGGNDGTSAQNYTVTATSSQRLASLSMSEQSTYGTFGGSWSGASNNTIWTRSLSVDDADPKGSASFNSLSAVNLAGIETTSINSGTTYTLGGFVSRNLTLPAFNNEIASNVDAVDFSKVTLTWSFKSLPTKSTLGDSTTPQANTWTLATLTPATARILDTAATGSSSQATTVTIEETV